MTTPAPTHKCNLPTSWHQTLKTLCQRPINAQQRHYYLTFLRKKLFPNPNPENNHTFITILPTTTILLLIKACQHLKDWPLIIHCCEEYQNRLNRAVTNPLSRHSLNNLHLLSQAYQHLGLYDLAQHTLQQAINHSGQPPQPLLDAYQQLQKQTTALPNGIDTLQVDPLILTPLQSHHEDNFRWQYADPTIAELCNLPDFNQDDEEDWQQWLRTNQTAAKHLFAVNHRHWGFIGSVGLEHFKDVGFFHYWLGKDFRGQGYGPQAVTILLDWARRYLGLRCCYATTYRDNIPSRKALAKIGFQPIPLKVILPDSPDYEEDLFYRGNHQSDRTLFSEISRLFIERDFEGQVVLAEGRRGDITLAA
ncbi:MAG: GNAT family N-acetyltransferase [Leptolyngbya sp. SIO1E4]|nr:GNAT family N-acetyltransferase [Leptolyngbya sp. SIO1E4]